MHGELIDICEEFFIIRMESQQEKKQKQQEQQEGEGSVMNRTTQSMLSISSMSMIGSILSMEADEGSSTDQFEDEWSQGFALRPTMIPVAYFPKSLAEKILFMGKAVRVLQNQRAREQDRIPEADLQAF